MSEAKSSGQQWVSSANLWSMELIGNVRNWASIIEANTMEQAQKIAAMPFVAGPLALMPDAHLGKGATVGSVIPTKGAIIPAAVGVDIGCGMIAVRLNLTSAHLPDHLYGLRDGIEIAVPSGVGRGHIFNSDWDRMRHTRKVPAYDGPTQLTGKQVNTITDQMGTLGSGNHFVEVCLDEIDRVWLVLHSGSRGIGNQLATQHINKAKGFMKEINMSLPDPDLAYFLEDHADFQDYIRDLLWAQKYAFENRAVMMNATIAVAKSFFEGKDVKEQERINCHHNFTQREVHNGDKVWLTRKGAIQARTGDLGIIPGSMGAASYIVRGLGNELSYNSCSHGAGRTMSRGQAKREITDEELIADMGDRVWLDRDVHELRDESPRAYKDIDVVMNDQKDLVEIVHNLHSIVNYKGL
jgi:RNA-splicing ligase RtcB